MPTPPPDDATREAVDAALAAQQRRHDDEIRQITQRHAMMMKQQRTSVRWQIGDIVVGLRSIAGWKRLPGKLGHLRASARTRTQRATATARADWAGVAARDSRRAVTVLDEFSHACLAPELSIDPLPPADIAKVDGAELVFTETAWRGNDGDWSYAFTKYDGTGPLAELFQTARAHDVPTVLWNKEDPAHYDAFLPVARDVDIVLTTDTDCIDRYRSDLGHDRVAGLMFAAQPHIHNPIGRPFEAPRTVCFAGAWRGHRYPERGRQLAELLDAAATTGEIVIYDREPSSLEPEMRFPDRFTGSIAGTLSYRQMVEQYRRHACFLNVNSVSDSPTMVSRRVFEILACRTPVVSAPSRAIDEHLADIVAAPRTPAEMTDTIGRLVDDVDHRDRVGQLGYRAVMSRHTYQHRLAEVLPLVGVEGFDAPAMPTIDVICVSNRPDFLPRTVRNVAIQKYPHVRLIFVTNSDEFDPDEVDRALAELPNAIWFAMPPDKTLGECLNAARERATADFFAKFDDDDLYGAEYLSDMVLATRFADASVYGKRTFHAHLERTDQTVVRHEGNEFAYTTLVMGGTLLVRRRDTVGIDFEARPSGSDTRFLEACTDAGLRIFSTDRFNYLMARRGATASHTWTIDDDEFLATSRVLGSGSMVDQVLI